MKKDLGTTTSALTEPHHGEQAHEQVKHTLGPLFVGSIERTSIVRNHPNGFVLYRGFSEGDAALFAAAPEMLAALKLAEADIVEDLQIAGYDDEDATEYPALKAIRAAIAKAEGRSS